LEATTRQLTRNPNDAEAIRDYNFALARVFTIIRTARLDPWTQPLTVPGANGGFILTHRPDPRPNWNPALYEFTPADQFDVHGKYVSERTLRDGLGAPLVAIGRDVYKEARAEFALPRIYYGVTAIARFEGRRCVISFEDPLAVETVRFSGRTFPLAGDFTVPVAVMLARNNPKKFELTRLLRPEKYAATARIASSALDPNKSVVLVVILMERPLPDADDQHAAGRRRNPSQLSILVFQLPERLSVSLFSDDPAARTRRDREEVCPSQTYGCCWPQHGRLHQPAFADRHR
jgi:hypothetical protein